ncbi:hypothetical protein HerbRD11066_22080 [Herbidospora sp. RD11066]
MSRIAGRFTRVESRRRARKPVFDPLSDLPDYRRVGRGQDPDDMWHLRGRADQVRDDVAVLAVDETGDVKKGTDTVGVRRQHTGAAGGVENSQVAAYLAILDPARARGDRPGTPCSAFLGLQPRPLPGRGLGDKTEFATKSEPAARMVTQHLDAGHRAAWVARDEI